MSDVNLMAEKVSEHSRTPGPWEAWPETVKRGNEPVCLRIAIMAIDEDGPTGHIAFSDANARLIRAAPDMSAALRRALSWLSSYPGGNAEAAYMDAVNALKKAGTYE